MAAPKKRRIVARVTLLVGDPAKAIAVKPGEPADVDAVEAEGLVARGLAAWPMPEAARPRESGQVEAGLPLTGGASGGQDEEADES